MLLLQSVISGKGQEAYIALSEVQRKSHITVKDSTLKVQYMNVFPKPIGKYFEIGIKTRNKHI